MSEHLFCVYDTYGPAKNGGLIDRIQARFEVEGIEYTNVQVSPGVWAFKYSPTGQMYVDEEVLKYKLGRVRNLSGTWVRQINEAFSFLPGYHHLVLEPVLEALYHALDIPAELCDVCSIPHPRADLVSGQCPSCRRFNNESAGRSTP